MTADGKRAGHRTEGDGAIAGTGAGAEGQPRSVVTGGPGQGAAAGVADGEGLRGRIAAALGRCEGQAGWAHANGGWHGRGGDGEGDGNRDRGGSGGAEGDGATMTADGKCAGHRTEGDRAIAGTGAGAEGQPRSIVTAGPGQGAAAGVADAEGLRGGIAAALCRCTGEADGARADGGTD